MTNKDFAIATNKFFFYCMNYPVERFDYPTLFDGMAHSYLPSFFHAFDVNEMHHFAPKWEYAREKCGSYGAINKFYGELDGDYRAKVLSYINEHYTMRDDFGINIENL